MSLKFVHIPKTAGTSIENLAHEKGIIWGRFDRRHLVQFQRAVRVNVWHCPLNKFKLGNPYSGHPTFAVVRNPYERIVSNFGCPHISKDRNWGDSAEDLNRWIPKILEEIKKNPYLYDGHFIPQYHYIFDHLKRRQVTHVLNFENLHQEFNNLMKKYKIGISLDRHDNRQKKKVTIEDISPKNRLLIYNFYKNDFEYLFPEKRQEKAPIPKAKPLVKKSASNYPPIKLNKPVKKVVKKK